MVPVVVVGSGASGVHFALSALKKGHRVLMLDVGVRRPAALNPSDDFTALKENLDDPISYFLGAQYKSLILPDYGAEYYGFPPSKSYIFENARDFSYHARGFSPLVSFAAGGLAEAWTGGCYPFRDAELSAWPFGYKRLEPYYGEVARRIGISGTEDDLLPFFPLHDGVMEPLDLDEHSSLLLASYRRHSAYLNSKLRCYMGRSRVATLSRDLGDRKKCCQLGRCLWGCPTDSLYTPSLTLNECRTYPQFEYMPGYYATHFRFNSKQEVTEVVAQQVGNGPEREFRAGRLVLAAGALCSSEIFLQSFYRQTGEIIRLPGLMDNRQILMPFLNLRMIGRAYQPRSYQFHQVAIGVDGEGPLGYVHGLVTTLKTALLHPVVQSLPFDLGTSASVFRNLHSALGLVNINFADHRRQENCLTLEVDQKTGSSRLVIDYRPEAGEPQRLEGMTKLFRKVLRKLGCVAPSPMTHLRPMGASVHYAGTLPMSDQAAALTCTPQGQSRDFPNLYFADGTTFPSLPAKNLTFTLMANAARIAEEAF